jgi:plasmid stabilization system protein ParE
MTKDECRRPVGRKYKPGLDGGPGSMDKLLVAEAAEEEYTDSLRWYAERSIGAAEGFEATFEQALESIAAYPERYPLCDDRHRFFLLKRYPFQIIYRKTSQDRWLVVAVAHTSRRPGYWGIR